MGIYYPTNKGLKQFHKCNNHCLNWHVLSSATVDSHSVNMRIASTGESIMRHYYTDEENDALEQSIDNYIESQIDERICPNV